MSISIENTTVRCRRCNAEFCDDQIENATCCPVCSTTQRPVEIAHDVDIKMNWADLRMLMAYASNWADKCCDDETASMVGALARKMEEKRPADAAPLLILDEVRELQDQGIDAELIVNHKVVVPRRIPN